MSVNARTVRRSLLTALMLFTIGGLPSAHSTNAAGPTILYVAPEGSPLNSGTSWADANSSLLAVITQAPDNSEIWVKAGTYKPISPLAPGANDRTLAFPVRSGVAIYGGFAGSETARAQRNPATNVTILSGDLLSDDGPNFANRTDNTLHVVAASTSVAPADATAILDGFTITGGNANGNTLQTFAGGGIVVDQTSPTLSNLIITGNEAFAGGGIAFGQSNAQVRNVTIRDNRATNVPTNNDTGSGGGVAMSVSNVTIQDSTISNNRSAFGGAGIVMQGGAVTLTNVTISENQSAQASGAGMQGLRFAPLGEAGNINVTMTDVTFRNNRTAGTIGGVSLVNGAAALTRVTIDGNEADNNIGGFYFDTIAVTAQDVTVSNNRSGAGFAGGGVLLAVGTATTPSTITNLTMANNQANRNTSALIVQSNSNVELRNATIANNRSTTLPNEVGVFTSTLTLRNSIIWGTTALDNRGATITGNNSIVQGGLSGTGNRDVEPLLGALGNYGGPLQTVPLLPGSPAIDAAVNAVATDARGIARPQGTAADIGAFESRGFTLSSPVGTPQTTPLGTAFTTPLGLTVSSAANEPVAGGTVTFTGPTSGAALSTRVLTATIGANGAVSQAIRANSSAGGPYTVTANTAGAANPLSFSLTNANQRVFVPLVLIPGPQLTNGDFEQGSSGWTETPAAGVITTGAFDGVTPFSGNAMAVFGKTSPTVGGSLSQRITVPSGNPALTFNVQMRAPATMENPAECFVKFGTAVLYALDVRGNDSITDWRQVTVNMTPYVGKTDTLLVQCNLQGTPIAFFVDGMAMR